MLSCLNSVARLAGARDAWDLDWASLRFPDLQVLRQQVRETYSLNTTNTMVAAMRGVLRACWRLNQIDSDTFQQAMQLKSVRGNRLPAGRMLRPEEISALFAACAADSGPASARDTAAVALMLGGGLRRAEAASLPCNAIDLDEGWVQVVGKGNKERLVPLSPSVVAAVRDWLEVRGDAPGALFVHCRRGTLVRRGTTLLSIAPKGGALADALARRCQQAGIDRCTPHDLRRTYISVLLDTGVDPFTVQVLAGHSNPASTIRYDRRGDKRLREAAYRIQVPYVGPH